MAIKKTAVVTGASSGIGKEIARALVQQGWRVIGVGRDPRRMEEVRAEIGAAAGEAGSFEMLRADLSSLGESRALAQAIAKRTKRIDVLFNNAGGMTDRLAMTDEGLEASFATNHLGPFVLTQGLLPLLRAAAADASQQGSTRIVVTSSGASEAAPPFDFADIQGLADFKPGIAYCVAKLANMMFVRGLADRLAGTGIVSHAAAPGPVASRFFEYAPKETLDHVRDLPKLTEAQGADTLIWLATADEPGLINGGYWQDRKPRQPHAQASDPAAVAAFWDASEKLVATVLDG